jgi:uncharacterized protein YecE (DUF72 family)
MGRQLYIGTSGWHYDDWTKLFYPQDIKGYRELTFHAKYFNTVENNSSFYRIAGEETYKTWSRMTPANYKFSIKLNKFITHLHRLQITDEVVEKVQFILELTQVLGEKLGAILIQLPASFTYDLPRLHTFLAFFTKEVRNKPYAFDIALELRNKYWFTDDLYTLLKKYNVALVAGQSSRWPQIRQTTADIAYIRMHGPEKLFASSYSDEQLNEWALYVSSLPESVTRVYVYFNNDFHGYALKNAEKFKKLISETKLLRR